MLMLYFRMLYSPGTLGTLIYKRRITWLNFLEIFIKFTRNLIDFIKEIIFSEQVLGQSRNKKETDFTRNRKLPFAFLVLYQPAESEKSEAHLR